MIIIDRFEGEYAWLDVDGSMARMERHMIPSNAHEGDVIKPYADGYVVDAVATRARVALLEEKRRRALGMG